MVRMKLTLKRMDVKDSPILSFQSRRADVLTKSNISLCALSPLWAHELAISNHRQAHFLSFLFLVFKIHSIYYVSNGYNTYFGA